MKQITDQLFNDLTEELSLYAEMGTSPVKRVTGAIHSIRKALEALKNLVSGNPFGTPHEEIRFFKYDKPRFSAEHFYAMEIFTIATARPLNDRGLLKAFYEQELRYVQRYLAQNKFLYAYYQSDLKDLDPLLFLRDAKPADIPVPEMVGSDPAFSTCCDILWGKFMAFERLQEWLDHELATFEAPVEKAAGTEDIVYNAGGPGGLRWTGESINLAEFAYGIWLTGQVSNGQVYVTEITEFLEKVFRVKIGKPHLR